MKIYKVIDVTGEEKTEVGFYRTKELAIDTHVGERKDAVTVEHNGDTVRLSGKTFLGLDFIYVVVPVEVVE